MPVTCTAFNSSILALSGFPFMSGFYSKDAIMETFMINSYPIFTSFLCFFSIILTSAYSMRVSIMLL